MKPLRLMTLLAACCVVSTPVGSLWAAEPAPPKPAAPAAAPPAAEAATESTAPKADEDSQDQAGNKDGEAATAKPKASTADKAASPQRFVPTEQVRADFDVSFPIDI